MKPVFRCPPCLSLDFKQHAFHRQEQLEKVLSKSTSIDSNISSSQHFFTFRLPFEDVSHTSATWYACETVDRQNVPNGQPQEFSVNLLLTHICLAEEVSVEIAPEILLLMECLPNHHQSSTRTGDPVSQTQRGINVSHQATSETLLALALVLGEVLCKSFPHLEARLFSELTLLHLYKHWTRRNHQLPLCRYDLWSS